jgi:hypothetical protein
MNPTELLRRQHEEALAVFDELELTDDELERVRLLVQLAEKLKTHAAVEQDVFYPTVRAAAPERVDEALAAHRAFDVLLDEAVGAPSGANTTVLRRIIEQHFSDEERTLFALADAFDDATAEALAEHLRRYARAVEDEELAQSSSR